MIGPFATREDATGYLTASGTHHQYQVRRLLMPVDPPTEDADLND